MSIEFIESNFHLRLFSSMVYALLYTLLDLICITSVSTLFLLLQRQEKGDTLVCMNFSVHLLIIGVDLKTFPLHWRTSNLLLIFISESVKLKIPITESE